MYGIAADNLNLFILIAVRVMAILETAPLFSGQGIPRIAKLGLAGFSAALLLPVVKEAGYPIPNDGAIFALLIIGEALIGIVIGFFLTLLYSAFTMAGQMYSLQIGFGASETFDPVSQIEIPVMGQFLNLMAMFVFVSTQGFQKLFILGVQGSFKAIKAVDFLTRKDQFMNYFTHAMGGLFSQALILSFPVFGTLFIMTVALGLMSRATPQLNLLSDGFPINLLFAFSIMFIAGPLIMEVFARLIGAGFNDLARLLTGASL